MLSSKILLGQRVFFCKLKKNPTQWTISLPVPNLSSAVTWEKRRPRSFCSHLQPCSWFHSTLRDHEQSSSDEIPWVRCVHRSPAHLIEKVGRFDVRYISNDYTFLLSKGRQIHWYTGRGQTVKDVVENGYRFWTFWSEIGYGYRRNVHESL